MMPLHPHVVQLHRYTFAGDIVAIRWAFHDSWGLLFFLDDLMFWSIFFIGLFLLYLQLLIYERETSFTLKIHHLLYLSFRSKSNCEEVWLLLKDRNRRTERHGPEIELSPRCKIQHRSINNSRGTVFVDTRRSWAFISKWILLYNCSHQWTGKSLQAVL